MLIRIGTLVVLWLLLVACQSNSAPQPALVGCAAYATALESLSVRRELGLLSQSTIDRVNDLRAVATPLCTSPSPPSDAQMTLDKVLLDLERILAQTAGRSA